MTRFSGSFFARSAGFSRFCFLQPPQGATEASWEAMPPAGAGHVSPPRTTASRPWLLDSAPCGGYRPRTREVSTKRNTMSEPEHETASGFANEELPEGWQQPTLADVTVKIPNAKPQSEPEREFCYVDISSICNRTFSITECKSFEGKDAPSRAKRPIESDDVLFSNVRTYLRNVAVVPPKLHAQLCSTGFTVLRSNGAVDPYYLFRYVLSDEFVDQITGHQTGSNYPATSDKVVFRQPIPLPPLAEQERIVAAVERLFEQLRGVRARLERVPAILKRFRQSVLAAACSGRLTEDWRKQSSDLTSTSDLLRAIRSSHERGGTGHGGKAAQPTEGVHDLEQSEFPEAWSVEELKWLCAPGRPITYGILKPGPDQGSGVPYIRVADFPGDKLRVPGIRKTTQAIAGNYKRSSLRAGDVLLSIRGTVGRVCRVPDELEGANITQDTARISVCEGISTDYIETYLRCSSLQRRLEEATKGVAVRGVNIGDVRVLQIGLPPLEEQHEIARRVEALFRLADEIEGRVARATAWAEKLRQAILAKAFRGELVPTEAHLARQQARPYEPASELLERIKAEREKEKSPSPTRRRRRAAAPARQGSAQQDEFRI